MDFDERREIIESHIESTCSVCKIIKEEAEEIEQREKINEQLRKEGKPLLDNGSNLPDHCMWCIGNIVWLGDRWCSQKCAIKWNKKYKFSTGDKNE